MNQPRAYEATMASGGGILGNPIAFVTKPQVILKFASTFLSIVTYLCISSAWNQGKCLFNNYSGVCRFGALTLVAFVGSALFLVFEIVFDKISSIKVRRRVVIADVVFSGACAIFYILLFVFLGISWLKSSYPPWGIGINSCRVAIVFSFLSTFSMTACAAMAYIRYQSGVDMSQFLSPEQYADTGDPQAQQFQADPNATYTNGYDNSYIDGQDYTNYQQDPAQDRQQNAHNPFGGATNY